MTRMIGTFYEFFAGGGMARAGLGHRWECLFANDFDHKKSATYRKNWGEKELVTADVKNLSVCDLPNNADLVWGSFPCQDLSLAGGGAGLKGERSGTFWPFWDLMKGLGSIERAPKVIVLENVCGTLTSHGGKDFSAICSALQSADYSYGAMVIDASLFVPQSRPRLFIVGVHNSIPIPDAIISNEPSTPWHTRTLIRAYEKLSSQNKSSWTWWNMSKPKAQKFKFSDLIEDYPDSVSWHTPAQTNQLLAMMSKVHLEKVEKAKSSGERIVGTIYKRTRTDESGRKVQRAEVRFDSVAGCLRTPAGGSSRQLIMVVEGENIRSRLISSRETARLMGLPDTYELPDTYNEAYHLTGDGVVVPVVRHLVSKILEPIILSQKKSSQVAA